MSARAQVQVTLEISLPDSWGEDWRVGDLYKSAAETALNLIQSKLPMHSIKIIGHPEVTAILTTKG
jgi:hypothetical protein